MENNETLSEVSSAKKSGLSRNKIIAIVVACVLVVGAVIGIVLGVVLGKRYLNLDKMYVVGYENLQTIGVGENETASDVAYAASNNNSKLKLIGIKQDGSVELLKFSKEKNGQGEAADYYVNFFLPLNNFTIISFSDKSELNNFNHSLTLSNKSQDDLNYLLDNKTGRMYSLKVLNFEYATIFLDMNSSYFKYGRYCDFESKNSLYLPIKNSNESEDSLSIYRLTLDGENLKAEEVVNYNSVKFCEYFMVDNYDNLFLKEEKDSDNYTVLVDGKNAVHSLDSGKKLYRALNGYVYNKESNTKFNASGEEDVTQDRAEEIYLSRFNMIKKVGKTEYYYGYDKILGTDEEEWPTYTPSMNYIYKLDWDDNGVDYSVTSLQISSINFTEPSDYEYAANENFIYFLSSNSVIYVDILTGESNAFDTQGYVLRTLYGDNFGNVVFRAAKGTEQFTGVIKTDGSIEKYVQKSEFRVYYIAPKM